MLPVRLAGHVGEGEERLAARSHDLRRDLLALLLQQVGDHDLCALTGEKARLLTAHSGRPAADDRHLAR